MPELPEVETIVRELNQSVTGKSIEGFQVINESSVLISADTKLSELEGQRIMSVSRRGKFICINLKGMKVVVHLRMTGRLTWEVERDRRRYVRAVIIFSDRTKLYFSDVRKFGKIWITGKNDYDKFTGISKLGVEPFDNGFSAENLADLLKGRKGGLKAFLLKQDIIAGIGNIYADEICFDCGLHPDLRIEKLSGKKVADLHKSIVKCLSLGIQNCGASVSDFVGINGNLGKQQNYLFVYGRKDDGCYLCKTPISKCVSAGRGTHYCSKCQKLSISMT
jgi:formamidopyrimidine-DNA glycosylase